VARLCWRIRGRAEDLARIADERQGRYPPPESKQPRVTNLFGLLGPRGSGKTTLLVELGRRLDQDKRVSVKLADLVTRVRKLEEPGDGGRTVRSSPDEERIDCSPCPSGKETPDDCPRRSRSLRVLDPIDCSLCPTGIPLGLTLMHRVHDALRRRCETECDPQQMQSKAEEDFPALQEAYLNADPEYLALVRETAVSLEQYGRSAGRQIDQRFDLPRLVYCWLEQVCREAGVDTLVVPLDDVDLAPTDLAWGLWRSLLDELHQPRLLLVLSADEELLERHVRASAGKAASLDAIRALFYKVLREEDREHLRPWKLEDRRGFLPRQGDAEEGEAETIGSLVTAVQPLGGVLRHQLLPPFPRGLENIHERLWRLRAKELKGEDQAEEFLAALAEARAEHGLSRELYKRAPEHWARDFAWGHQEIDASAWSAFAAATRDEENPLWPLVPRTDTLPLQPRDLGDQSPLWAEQLVDAALHRRTLTPRALTARLPWLRERFLRAAIATGFPEQLLADTLPGPQDEALVELLWVEWEEPGEWVRARFGWPQFVSTLAGERDPASAPVLDHLSVPYHQLALSAPGPTAAELEFLPRAVRPLILLADALGSAPWEALSAQSRKRSPRDLARLVAGLTCAAYLQALDEPPRAATQPFQAALAAGESTDVLAWDNDVLAAHFSRFVTALRDRQSELETELLGRCLLALLDAARIDELA